MSLLRRLSRALETVSRLQLDNRSLFGALGEEYASQFLDGPDIISRVVNPIIPHSDGHRNPFESDFLVYTQGNLFCIEVERYKGRITYAQQSRARNAHFQRIGQEHVDGVDESMIVQEKWGNYGEPLPPKMHPNPLRKTRTCIRFLKEYLAENVDARFRTFFIIPVVAFVEEANISAIHSLEAGMIYVRELPIPRSPADRQPGSRMVFRSFPHRILSSRRTMTLSRDLLRIPCSASKEEMGSLSRYHTQTRLLFPVVVRSQPVSSLIPICWQTGPFC